MHLSHHASISYTLHTLCGHASILRASIFCAHFFTFSANTSTASSGKHCRVLARTHMLAACAQYLLHARYTLTASFLQALATILSRAYFYKGCLHLMPLRISKQFPSQWPLIIPACPLNPAMHYTLIWVFVYQIWWSQGILKIFDLWLTPASPLHHFWPQQWITHWSGVISTIFGDLKAVLIWPPVDPGCPYMVFDPSNTLHLLTLNCIKGGFHGTQHLVFRLSHFNAAIFRADNFCNCLNSSCAPFGEKKNWGPPRRFCAN